MADSASRSADHVHGGPLVGGPSGLTATWALFCGLALLMTGNGLQSTLLGVRSADEGFGLLVSGFIMTSYFFGFFVGSASAVHALAAVGHIRVFAALASVASAAVLIPTIWVHPVTWGVLRLLVGVCMAGLFVVAESWLNDTTTNASRGRMLAGYMAVSMGGLAVGQLLLNLADPVGFELFVLASVLVSLSLVPVTLSARAAPPLRAPRPMPFRELLSAVPTAVVTVFWVGAAAGIIIGLGPVYGAAVGLDTSRIAWFVAAPMVGAVVWQWPVGMAADRFPRRAVLVTVAAGAAATAAGLLAIDGNSSLSIGLMFLLGGATFSLYSLAIAYANDWVSRDQAASTSAALIRTHGAGAVLGPAATAALMEAVEPKAFFGALVATHVIIVGYVAHRIVVADALPVRRQRRFVVFPGRAAELAAGLLHHRRMEDQ